MDIVDLSSEDGDGGAGGLDAVKSDFNKDLEDKGEAVMQSLEDGDQVVTMDDQALYQALYQPSIPSIDSTQTSN
jgi:hypothetical protein